MIDRLLAVLAAADIQVAPRELRDALWLAEHITVPDRPEPVDRPRHQPTGIPEAHSPSTSPTQPEHHFAHTATERVADNAGELYAAGGGAELHGVAARSPAVPALRGKLGLARALRPLKRRVPSRTEFAVDEDATARRIADEDLWVPVFRPTTTRWLNLALVIDAAPSMVVWRRTVTELRALADQLGVFRQIRTFTVDSSVAPDVPLAICHGRGQPKDDPATLNDPTGRQAVLVVTDSVGGTWRDGRMRELLQSWGSASSTAVITLLPQRMWIGTGLRPVPTELHTPTPAASNREWEHRAREKAAGATGDQTPIPVLELSPRWLASWANLVAGGSGWQRAAVLGPAQPYHHGHHHPAVDDPALLVDRFRAAASPTAFRLACYLSAAWLNLPVMRLVQRVMLPDSTTSHLAEVFLGGLLYRCEPTHDIADPELAQYEFIRGVRGELNSYLLRDDLIKVLHATTEFITDRFGQSLDFAALLADPQGVPLPALGAGTGRPLAYVAATVLAKLGGRYRTLGTRLSRLDRGAVAARTVGRVVLRDEQGRVVGLATGSMVSPQLLLTNDHVLRDSDVARRSEVQFDFQDGADGQPLPASTFGLDPDRFFVADETLDFALVAVRAEPSELALFGHNTLTDFKSKASLDEQLTIIHHPIGGKKQIGLREYRVIEVVDPFVHYRTDNEASSSGSPVFNDRWELVALHHSAVPAPQNGESGGLVCEGLQIGPLLRFLRTRRYPPHQRVLVDELLRAAKPTDTTTNDPRYTTAIDDRVDDEPRRGATTGRYTELYSKAVEQLGSENAPIRLDGLHALELLAQDNDIERQTIVDVLCAYLRVPYQPLTEPLSLGATYDRLSSSRQQVEEFDVRIAAQHILADHLTPDRGHAYWGECDLDLNGAHLHNVNLNACSVGNVRCDGASFAGSASFGRATFAGDTRFDGASFAGDTFFNEATFAGDTRFDGASFAGDTFFNEATFAGDTRFDGASFAGDTILNGTTFVGEASFHGATQNGANFDLTYFDSEEASRKHSSAQVFLSYRTADEKFGAALVGQLLSEWLRPPTAVFTTQSLPLDADWDPDILRVLKKSIAVVVLIGRNWLEACDSDGRRRLDDPNDFVRRDIATAFALGKEVFPVLLGVQPMELRKESLPLDIRRLADLQFIPIELDRGQPDVSHLAAALSHLVSAPQREAPENLAERTVLSDDSANAANADDALASWAWLRSWGIQDVAFATTIKNAIEARCRELNDPSRPRMAQPIPDVAMNRLELVLFDPERKPPADPTLGPEEQKRANASFIENGARAVRDHLEHLTQTFAGTDSPFQIPDGHARRKSKQALYRRLYRTLCAVTDEP